MVSEGNVRPLRVLQVVSSGGVTSGTQQTLFMPLATRLPKERVRTQVVSLSTDAVPAAVLRQGGIPVHDIALSRTRFSASALKDLINAANLFRPDVIQAWGHTAQIAATALRSRCDWNPKLVWSNSETPPLAAGAGLIDRQKLKLAVRLSARVDRFIYPSEASAAAHRRAGFPEDKQAVIPPGVDPMRFKPDFASRRKVREQLGLDHDAFVLGMVAPFQPEFDHVTMLRAVGELIRTIPNVFVLLAGHGVQKGNAPLMALVGGGPLGVRTQLLGEWSDIAALYNACDVACSSAITDSLRMNLVAAMLCGIPCVASGMGAQGEVMGQFGVSIEKGSQTALVRGINKILQLTPERRAFMAKSARKHAMDNYALVRSLQKYQQQYFDLVGRDALKGADLTSQEMDASIPEPTEEELTAARAASLKRPPRLVTLSQLTDPDSLETQAQSFDTPPPTFFTPPPPRPEALRPPKPEHEGDVLQSFESSIKGQEAASTPMTERARGVADDLGDLLAPELMQSDEPAPGPRPAAPPPPPAIAKRTIEAKAKEPTSQPAPAVAANGPQEDVATGSSSQGQLELLADEPAQLQLAVGNHS